MKTKDAWKLLTIQLLLTRKKAEEIGWEFLERDENGNCFFRLRLPDAAFTLIVSDPR